MASLPYVRANSTVKQGPNVADMTSTWAPEALSPAAKRRTLRRYQTSSQKFSLAEFMSM